LDSGWEAEFCRVAESHPKVKAYAKNHNLGLEVPYRHGSEVRTYLPDFIVLVDDGHGDDDRLHLIVEIKGYQREDVREKKTTIETYWVPGVNNLGTYGRWAFAQFTDGYQIESVFKASVESEFDKMIADVEQTVSLLPTQKYSISEAPGRPINMTHFRYKERYTRNLPHIQPPVEDHERISIEPRPQGEAGTGSDAPG
jgi:hypothetical protein